MLNSMTYFFRKIFLFILNLDTLISLYVSRKNLNSETFNIFYKIFKKDDVESFFHFITRFGEGYFEIFLILTLLFYFLYNKKKIYKNCSLDIFITFLYTQVIVNILKMAFGRVRPYFLENPAKFYGFFYLIKNNLLLNSAYHSFPSGHTITIWGSIWLLCNYFHNMYTKFFLFTLGILVAISRVYLGFHWFSDVIASIIFSYFIAKFVYHKKYFN